jgi:hypothetical protein
VCASEVGLHPTSVLTYRTIPLDMLWEGTSIMTPFSALYSTALMRSVRMVFVRYFVQAHWFIILLAVNIPTSGMRMGDACTSNSRPAFMQA